MKLFFRLFLLCSVAAPAFAEPSRIIIPPLFVRDRQPDKSATWIGPYFHSENKKTQSNTRVVFPFVAMHDQPDYKVRAITPLFWRVHDGAETDTVVFPFYWRASSPDRHIDGLFPIFLHARTNFATTTIFGPFWNRKQTDGGRALGLLPLFAYGKSITDGKASRYFASPLAVYTSNEKKRTSALWAAGLFFDTHKGDNYTAGLVPLGFAWRRDGATRVLAPLFFHLHDKPHDELLDVIGPLYFGHKRDEKRVGLFPLYFGKYRSDGTSSTTFFPLFHFNKQKDSSMFLSFLGGYKKDKSGMRAEIALVYARKDQNVTSGAVWPLFYFMRDRYSGAQANMALPFLFDGRAHDGRELQMYSPLVWRYHTIEGSTIVGVPLWFDSHKYDESRVFGFWPLFIRHKSEASKSSSIVLPPLALWVRERHDTEKAHDFAFFPLIWHFGGTEKSTSLGIPIVWDFKRGENRTTVVAPVFARWRRSTQDHYLVLNFYYRKGIGPEEGSYHANFFPLFDFGRPRKEDVAWNILEGLVGYKRAGQKRTLRIFWGIDIKLENANAKSSVTSWFGSTPPSARTEF